MVKFSKSVSTWLKWLGLVIPILVVIVGAAIAYGMMRSEVDTLQEKVAELQKPESKRGDICAALIESMNKGIQSGDDEMIERAERQLIQFNCHNVSTEFPANMPNELRDLMGQDVAAEAAAEATMEEELPAHAEAEAEAE